MIASITILQQATDYTFIWPPALLAPASDRTTAGALCCATTSLHPHQQAELQAAIDSAAQVADELREPADGGQSGRASIQPLLRLGRLLFGHLLPPALQDLIRGLPPATPLLICTNDTELPWELLHDDQEFLALRHAVARQLLVGSAGRPALLRPHQPLTCLLVGNPNGNLAAADDEVESLLDLLDMAPQRVRVEFLCREHASKMRVMAALASGDYDLLHFACHARPGALSLADGWLAAEEIQAVLRGSPLVFLNACSSGRLPGRRPESLPFAGQQAHSLAQAFLAGGAAAFVGTAWPVDDGEIRWLALEFYRCLLGGHSLGAALRQARARSHTRVSQARSWAAPVLYGDPRHRLPQPAIQRQPGTLLAVRLLPGQTSSSGGSLEAQAVHLQRLLAQIGAVLAGYGGEWSMPETDQIRAVFGLPEPVEDDALRAMRAAVEIRRLCEAETTGCAAAIASGEIVRMTIGPDGAPPGATSAVPLYLGPVLAEVDALLAQGRRSQVLVNERARQLAEGYFQFEALAAGGADTAAAYELCGLPAGDDSPPSVESAAPRPPGQLVGRERELELMAAYWQSAREGRGQVVGIVGEAGIGKTRLLHAFRQTLAPDGQLWINLVCPSTGSDTPYMLVGQFLRQVFGILPGEGATVAEAKIARRLAELPGVSSPADPQLNQILRETLGLSTSELPVEERKARRGRLVHLLRTLMANAAQQQPLLIAVDDLHWVDEASLEILGQVTDGIGRLPVQLVVIYRPDWQHGWFDKTYYRHLPLDQLDEVASVELLCSLLQTDQLPKGLSALLKKTGGNPFFIGEMVKSLQETGVLVQRGTRDGAAAGGWELQRPLTEYQLPGTVERALRVRLESLTPATRQVLEAAAVMGPVFGQPLLQTLLATLPEPVEQTLAELERRGFVEARWDVQEYRFCHALILDAVYQGLPAGQRMAWHRRIAEMLEGAETQPSAEVETLAHHYYHSLLLSPAGAPPKLDESAAPEQAAKALAYLVQCGRRAQERYAAREALTYYQRALMLSRLSKTDEQAGAQIHEGLGDAYNILGSFDAAGQELRQAHAALHIRPLSPADCRRAADLARRIGRLCAWRGEHEVALEWMKQGLRQLTTGQDEDIDPDERAVGALLHIHMGSVYYNQGATGRALEMCKHGLRMAEDAALPAACAEGHNLLGVVYSSLRQNERALEHYRQSLAIWEAQGNRYQAARVEGNIGIVHFDQGELSTAQTYYVRNLAYLEEIEDQDRLAYRYLNLGNVYLCQGQLQQARASFETALTLWQTIDNQRWIALCHTNLGLVAIEEQAWEQARAHLETSRERLVHLNIRDMLPEVFYSLAEVALGQGDRATALTLAQQASALAEELAMPFERALALRNEARALAAGGQTTDARARLETCLHLLRELASRYELGRTLTWLARLNAVEGQWEEAKAALAEAHTLCAEIGALRELANVQTLAEQFALEWIPGESTRSTVGSER